MTFETEETALEPCPFCGAKPEVKVEFAPQVICPHCKARGPTMPVGEQTFRTSRDFDGRAEWNTRAALGRGGRGA